MAETIDTILERMLLQIPSRYDTSSGTYTYDIEKSTAMEFENVYDIISSLDSYFYASTATGKYLDMRVGEFGLERKEASYATGCVTVSGNVGAKVSVGEKVAAGNVIFNITENAIIPNGGSVTVQVVCDSAGVKGNVEKGKINRFPVTIQGLISVTNEISTTGGSDKESDVELRKRFTEYVSHPITSGNKWQYISWAKSVDGVGDAKCLPLWNGAGTVKVIIVDSEKQLAGSELINKVQSYIDEQCPIGADVTVTTATAVSINVTFSADVDESTIESIKSNIRSYLRDVSFANGYVSYAKIGQTILNTDGVDDYSNLKINSKTENIAISETEIAVLGGVTVG